MIEKIVKVDSYEQVISLFGKYDENINILQKEYNVIIFSRGSDIKISGKEEDVARASRAVDGLLSLVRKGEIINEHNIKYVISMANEGTQTEFENLYNSCIAVSASGKPVRPKTITQKKYIDAITNNTITLGVGPAGTGKTYLAVSMAVKALKADDVTKIILTRPAVEAGEKLGFLPGDLQTKVDPYLRPLYDALFDMLGAEAFHRNLERSSIEVAPLAYMRGRTLDDAFIILDEAQNSTPEQMKMFLTRLGFNSKMIITGDVTQIDLPDARRSGLIDAMNVLNDVEDISIVNFTEKDVVRHRLVQEIVKAYEKNKDESGKNKSW
ncbi:MAG: phosphate starvation-inducible protein PhoH [Clostridiales bacterium]|nr:phosphate starvation-inducible protein PhoH [Clostridiales bacterium]